MSARIFISFASEDRGVAMTLCSALESRGFKCWISSRDILPGENFQIAIVRAIREAKIMLLVFTANSNNSEEMSKELALASQNKLMVVPLRVEDVTPNDAFSYEFATRQWIDLFSDWEFAIHQLSQRLETAMRALDAGEEASLSHEPHEETAAEDPASTPARRSPLSILMTNAAASAEDVQTSEAAVTPDKDGDAHATEDDIAGESAKPRRTGLLVALTLVVVIAVGAGVTAMRWLHSGSKPADQRAMVMLPATAPATPATPAAPAATAPAADPDAQALADKPQPRKHKAPAPKPADQEVPF